MGNLFKKTEQPEETSKLLDETRKLSGELKATLTSVPDITSMQVKVAELKRENKTLKQLLEQERAEKAKLLEQLTMRETSPQESQSDSKRFTRQEIKSISKHNIELFVDNMLKDPDINIGVLPDVIERKIYINMFKIMLGILDNLLDSTKIEFMGHEIAFDLKSHQE